MNDSPELNRLREAWRLRESEPASPCPESDKIWDALAGSLRQPDLNALVRHTAVCPACAEQWRLAHELGAMQERGAQVVELAPQRARHIPVLALAAGLVLLIGLGLFLWQWQAPKPSAPAPVAPVISREPPGSPATGSAPGYRTGEQLSISSLVSESRPVSRGACRLAWTPGPSGTRYSIMVTTTEMQELDRAENLTSSSYLVPPATLAGLSAGTRLMWQVHALLPGGERIVSPTFFVTLE